MNTTITITPEKQLIESFKVAPTDAQQIISAFGETAATISVLDKNFTEFSNVKEINEEVCADAKTLRLQYVKARTGADSVHKEIKAQVLLRSKAIDGARNIFKLQISEREKHLMEIEKHFEKIEEEKKQKKMLERIELLKAIGIEDVKDLYLDQMTDQIWDGYYSGAKLKIEVDNKRIADELAEEQKRIADKAIEDERIRKENKELQKERDAAQKKIDDANKKLADAQKKIDDAKDAENARVAKELADKLYSDAKAKKDAETAEKATKNKKYIDWLAANNVTPEEINGTSSLKSPFFVIREGNKFRLCKEIHTLTI